MTEKNKRVFIKYTQEQRKALKLHEQPDTFYDAEKYPSLKKFNGQAAPRDQDD